MATENLARRVVDKYKSRSTEVAHAMAAQIGTPIDGQEPTREQRVRLWLYQAPGVDPAMVMTALQSGQIQPAQAVDAVFPYRAKLIGSGTPKARVEAAEKLAAEAEKWQAEQQALMPPPPPMAPPIPTMAPPPMQPEPMAVPEQALPVAPPPLAPDGPMPPQEAPV